MLCHFSALHTVLGTGDVLTGNGLQVLDYVLKVLFSLHFYQLVMGFVEVLTLSWC